MARARTLCLLLGLPLAAPFAVPPPAAGTARAGRGAGWHPVAPRQRPAMAGTRWGGTGRKAERGSGSGSEYSEEDEENMKKMKKERVLPFDKGASEFVPTDMQPANEWQTLKETFLFDWPLLETPQFALKVASCFGFWFLFSLPIASETWSADSELAPRILAAVLGGAIPSLLILLRLFFGVKMVSDRLGQDAVYFESDERRPTTAVDLQRLGYRNQGATWIKPQEIAARDKLIKQFEVAPVLDFDPRFVESEARLDQLRSTSYEAVANREGERLRELGNKPAYCYNRYYKAVATSDLDKCR